MIFFKKTQSKLKRLKRDESGSMAVGWALSIGVMAIVIGAAIDLAVLQSADARSQSLADTTALAAAVFIRNNARTPNDREEGLIGEYSADELGYDFSGWVEGGASGVNINVAYDEVEREAIVTVRGNTRPTVLQVIGSDLEFYSETTVKFEEKEPLAPASVVLVLDNSGSMGFDDNPFDENGDIPPGTQPRINGLKTAANNFMTFMDDTIGPQVEHPTVPRVLRTGMMAFSSGIIHSRTVNMNWGTIKEQSINNMRPGGSTNSAPPLTTANTWLNLNEPPIHAAENPHENPLKYLVLMTDGRNTVGDEQWVARPGVENWRAWLQVGSHLEFTEDFEIVNAFVPGGQCKITNGHSNQQRYVYRRSNGSTFNDFTSERVECLSQVEVPDFDWVYREQEDRPLEAGNWEEGEFDIESNILTRAQCDSLNDSGVEIFTIAYALAVGTYNRNFTNGSVSVVTAEKSNIALSLLQYCATRPDNFITADNSEALNEAFTRIGNTIVKEVIRIES